MGLLASIESPADLKRLPSEAIPLLAQEIRDFLIREVSRTGGHLGPNLGVVELTIALHRVFDSPDDSIIFDTGHQAYVHKLLTGRQDFSGLRSKDGLSGYPSRAESEHDIVENSHASTSLAWAEGIAKARRLRRENRHTVAIIGDGALTGGMAWEALNNIASDKTLPLVIVVNDNERSYAPTIGGVADHLAALRTTRQYEQVLDWGKGALSRTPVVGRTAYQAFHSMKKGAKDFWAPQGMFEDLGIKYLGPVDGHDEASVEQALERAKSYGGPVLVHCITQKGRGYTHAVDDMADHFHGIGKINPETGLPLELSGRSWTDVFSEELVSLGRERRDIVAITAAMMMPVGLQPFAEAFPERIFDVGIAEQHALTMAAGLAHGGLHPVVAIYATFLNRAFDQLLMDCAMHRQGVTLVLDRAGITGPDGASHHGMWDMTLAGLVPGLHLAAPRDPDHLTAALRGAVEIENAPSIVRIPKGKADESIPALSVEEGFEVLYTGGAGGADDPWDLTIIAIGAMAGTGIAVGQALTAGGRSVRVLDPVWALPVHPEVVAAAAGSRAVAVIEDNLAHGGIGTAITRALDDAGVDAPVHGFGIRKEFHAHASRGQVLEANGLTAPAISAALDSRLPHRAKRPH